jgi:dTDP-4-amino-4,6-dideoxygalactose transaminase
MITTDDRALAARITVLRAHGAVRGDLYMEFVEAGFNYRLSDVHAAIGLAQMRKFDYILDQRRARAEALTQRLAGLDGVRSPSAPADIAHTYQSYVVLLADDIDRDGVIRSMRAREVETTLGTYGMHLQPYFVQRFGDQAEILPHATRAHRQALTLPLYPQLTDDDLDRIVDALGGAITENRA